MTKSIEKRLEELEAQIRALSNLVLSDLVSTTEDGLRDLTGALDLAEVQVKAAIDSGKGLSGVYLHDLISDVREALGPEPGE